MSNLLTRSPLRPVTDSELREYHENGVVLLRGMFDRQWVDRIYAAVERSMASPGPRTREATRPGEPGRFHMNVFMWRWDPDFRSFALHSPAAAIASRFLGGRSVRFFYDQIFAKEPGTQAVTHWHHDLPYWPLRGEEIVTLWLALTPVTRETSGVEYIAGSHRWGKFYRAVTPDRDPHFTDQSLEVCPDFDRHRGDPAYRFLSFEMEPGDVTVHHPLVVHGAGGNRSPTQRRMALATRYFSDGVVWDPRPATLVLPKGFSLPSGAALTDDGQFPVVWPQPPA